MSWFYIALLAPTLYAVVNIIDDNMLHTITATPYILTAMAGFLGMTPLISRFWINANALPPKLATIMIFAGFCLSLFFFFYYKALDLEQPSVVVAVINLVPATIPFLAYFFLHEQIAHLEIIGFILVIFSSLLIAVVDIKKFKFSAALIPILIGVVFMDISTILSKYVYERADFYPSYLYYTLGIGLGGLYFLYIIIHSKKFNSFKNLKKSILRLLPIFLVAEALNIAAEFALSLATSRGPVSAVKVIEGVQPIFVLLIAMAFYPLAPKYFREAATGQRSKKLLLMTLAVIGLIIINIASRS